MDTKSLSSRHVCWVQKLSQYHFQIDYCQGKVNVAIDALSRFPQKSRNEKDELRAENGQIIHGLRNLLTNASLAGLSLSFFFPSHLYPVLIYRTYVRLQLRHFWNNLQEELVSKALYTASINGMRLTSHKLQAKDKQAQNLRANQKPGQQGWEDINGVLHH